jgi:hypothetical protein
VSLCSVERALHFTVINGEAFGEGSGFARGLCVAPSGRDVTFEEGQGGGRGRRCRRAPCARPGLKPSAVILLARLFRRDRVGVVLTRCEGPLLYGATAAR